MPPFHGTQTLAVYYKSVASAVYAVVYVSEYVDIYIYSLPDNSNDTSNDIQFRESQRTMKRTHNGGAHETHP